MPTNTLNTHHAGGEGALVQSVGLAAPQHSSVQLAPAQLGHAQQRRLRRLLRLALLLLLLLAGWRVSCVTAHLRIDGGSCNVGGRVLFLHQLIRACPCSSLLLHHCGCVHWHSIARAVRRRCSARVWCLLCCVHRNHHQLSRL
jgi:hypothetical protein